MQNDECGVGRLRSNPACVHGFGFAHHKLWAKWAEEYWGGHFVNGMWYVCADDRES